MKAYNLKLGDILKIGIMSKEIGWQRPPYETLEDVISKSAKLGFDGVELEFGSPRLHAWDIARAKKIKELIDSKGLAISNLSPATAFLHRGWWAEEKELLNIHACCEMANAIDAPHIRVQICAWNYRFLSQPPSLSQQYSQGFSVLKKALKIAEEFGVTLGLDNHFSLTVMDHLRIVKEINSPNLKLYIDVRNAQSHGEDYLATIRAAGKLLIHNHHKDGVEGVGIGGEKFSVGVPIGMGNIFDWEALLTAFKEIGYEGYHSIEGAHVIPAYTPWECLETGLKFLRDMGKKLSM